MQRTTSIFGPDLLFFIGLVALSSLGVMVLRAISPQIFPQYFLYVFLGFIAYIVFAQIDFDILSIFSRHFYIGSIIFLILPIIIGQVTRGTIRWVTLGPLNIQPAEIVRPFLLVFFANYLAGRELNLKKVFRAIGLFLIPFVLIALQPSLGVAVLTAFGFLGVLLASPLEKRYFIFGGVAFLAVIPLFWMILAPYQKK